MLKPEIFFLKDFDTSRKILWSKLPLINRNAEINKAYHQLLQALVGTSDSEEINKIMQSYFVAIKEGIQTRLLSDLEWIKKRL